VSGGEDRNGSGFPEEAPEEEDGGKLATDPELEAAMREALESIPDGARREEPKPEDDPEVVLSNPIEGDPIKEVHRLQSELAETHDRLLRLQADFENFRRRAGREHREALLFGPQNVVKDLLSVVDNLDRAIDHARKSEGGDLQGLLQGVELVKRELLGVLEKHHVTEIDAQGQPFDPAYHEAMAQVHDDAVEPNTVLEVLQKGYQLRDRLLRPAQVVVAKRPEGAGGSGQGEAPE
jgi:molecular chaperone GrpE